VTRTTADRIHAALMLLAAVITAAYWWLYFTSGATRSRSDAVYLGFESAFPFADGWMSLCFVVSAVLLLRNDARAIFWGLCAGSAMVYLASMDLLFDLEQHVFSVQMNGEAWAEAAIVTSCWLLGPITLARLWHHPLRST
jgi:hypothetical protein